MLALADTPRHPRGQARLHALFLALLPHVEQHGRIYFRHLRCPHKKADALQEMRSLAWKWFLRLHQRGKDPGEFVSAFSTLLARAVNSGRRLAGMARARDVLNPHAQRRHGFTVERLPGSPRLCHDLLYASPKGQELFDALEERLRDNTITPPDQQAAFRIDFVAWLKSLTPRERRLVRAMARNERTKDLARGFELSPARISQMRREFYDDWTRFCGDQPGDGSR